MGPARAVGRDVAVVLGTFLVLGVLGGLLWWTLVTPAEVTRLPTGVGMAEEQLGRRFGADGWFALVGVAGGLPAGLALAWWRSRDPLLTSVLLVVGSALALTAALVVGHLVGPGDPREALSAARVGTSLPEPLDVDTPAAYLGWPVGALAGALVVLLGRLPRPENRPRVAGTPA